VEQASLPAASDFFFGEGRQARMPAPLTLRKDNSQPSAESPQTGERLAVTVRINEVDRTANVFLALWSSSYIFY
jgi:hypothetical protein